VRELGRVLLESPRVRTSRVQEHEGLALAVFLVVGVDAAELYVVRHPNCSFGRLDLRAGVAQQDDNVFERPRFDGQEFDRFVELAEEGGSASERGLFDSLAVFYSLGGLE
jgi:hypothetical protein